MDEIDAMNIDELSEGRGSEPPSGKYFIDAEGNVTAELRLPIGGSPRSKLMISVSLETRNSPGTYRFFKEAEALIKTVKLLEERGAVGVIERTRLLVRGEATEACPVPD
jgi:hypothetical protein